MRESLSSTTIPGPLRSTPGTSRSSFDSRLPFARAVPAAELTLSPRIAFEMTVSAACYLSVMGEGDTPALLEAIQMLHDCSLDIREDGLTLGLDHQTMEDRIWDSKQSRWERQKAIAAAIHYVTHPGDAHPLPPARRQRWTSRLLGLFSMQN